MKICFHVPHFLFAAFLLISAFALSAQNGSASALEPARIAMLQEDYRTAAKEASKLYFLSSDSAVAEEALKLSISANLAIRNAGGKVSDSFSLRINKAAKRLLVLTAEETIYRSFELECGADFSVPSGTFTVGTKLVLQVQPAGQHAWQPLARTAQRGRNTRLRNSRRSPADSRIRTPVFPSEELRHQ